MSEEIYKDSYGCLWSVKGTVATLLANPFGYRHNELPLPIGFKKDYSLLVEHLGPVEIYSRQGVIHTKLPTGSKVRVRNGQIFFDAEQTTDNQSTHDNEFVGTVIEQLPGERVKISLELIGNASDYTKYELTQEPISMKNADLENYSKPYSEWTREELEKEWRSRWPMGTAPNRTEELIEKLEYHDSVRKLQQAVRDKGINIK